MSIMSEEILSQATLLERCFSSNVGNVIGLADEVKRRKIHEIVIVARGSSRNACEYFKYLCEVNCGLRVSFCYPSIYTQYKAKPYVSRALYLAVSQGGRGEDINYVLSAARKAGGFTAAITNDELSRLARNADFHLFLNVGQEKSMAATKTFSAEMLVLGMLAYALANKDLGVFAQIGELYLPQPRQTQAIAELADRLKNTSSLFVLSRGYCLCVAKELCCKLQETCFVNANGYATSDFMHGPLALIDDRKTVIVFASKDATLDDTSAMLSRLRDAQATIILISNQRALTEQYGGIDVDCDDEVLTPFAFTFVAQTLAEKLSHIKSTDPDKSRNLDKYTKTL